MSRQWHSDHTDRGISIGEGGSFSPRVWFVNPHDKSFYDGCAYVLWFGGFNATFLHIYSKSLDDALEECAGWLADHAPGHLMSFGSDEHQCLIKEQCEEREIDYSALDEHPDRDDVFQDAEADLTYTESGFLTSYEWGISLENPTTEELYAFIGGKC